jgi:predicted TIM-barrel fold metal-dependent hydrolase
MERDRFTAPRPALTSLDRRAILSGGAGLLLASAAPGISQAATAPIDIHHHFAPPFYKDKVAQWYRDTGASADAFLAWTPEAMLDGLDRAGGVRAALSISAPATALSSTAAEALDLARRCNDYAAELVAKRPNQLAFFVTVPMPHVKESIAEIDRAMALRGAIGVALLTSYDTKYLGHPDFDPLMQHMHERGLPVFVHPTIGPCCVGLTDSAAGVLIEFPVDTGRAIGNLVWSGALARYPGVKFVFSHGGGVTAMLTERLQMAGFAKPNAETLAPGGVDAMLRRIYVDTASATHPAAIAAARVQFGDDHVLFGTDAPWGAPARALASLDRLNLEPAFLDKVRQGNARKLISVFG